MLFSNSKHQNVLINLISSLITILRYNVAFYILNEGEKQAVHHRLHVLILYMSIAQADGTKTRLSWDKSAGLGYLAK